MILVPTAARAQATQVAKIVAPDAAAYDEFGFAVAVSADTALVGALYDDDAGTGSGSVYIFGRNEGGTDNWGQVAKITASDAAATDYFGIAVAVSGDTAVVGAHLDDDAGSSSGSAYIFGRNEGGTDNWGQVAKITASDPAAQDYFGYAVAMSGDVALVGAYDDDDSAYNTGSAYIFGTPGGDDDDDDDDDDEKEEEARRPGVVLALVGSGVGAVVVLSGVGAAVFISARRSSDDEAGAKDGAEAELAEKK